MLPGCIAMMLVFILPPKAYGTILQIPDEDPMQLKGSLKRDTVHLTIRGPSNDVAFYMNGLVFLSNSKYHQKMIPDHITFGQEQAYFVPLEFISQESSKPLFENDPFPYPPGGMSFTRDYSKVYFTKPIELSGRRTVEKIYEMSIVQSGGSEHKILPFCDDPSRCMHPAVSTDGSLMVFASDRMPSSGGLDLFMSEKSGNGWSAPVNLGRTINTSGHEWYPFLDHHKNLYFSSTGHMGLGGYDIYICPFNGIGWGEPMNMTEFINSEKDEIAFSIHPNKRIAVYSTSYGSDRSHAQVYLVSLKTDVIPPDHTAETLQNDLATFFLEMAEPGYTATQPAVREEVADEQLAEKTEQVAEEEQVSEEAVPVEEVPVEEEILPADETSRVETAEPLQQKAEAAGTEADQVVFRVQILSSMKPKTKSAVTIAGKKYDTFEYLYKGAYRITVGAFSDVQDALEFRNTCRRAGYDQAFVAAFRNDERELDPSVFDR